MLTKMNTLLVGVKKKMIINSMTEVHGDLRGDTRPQARKKQSSSFQITLSRYEGCSSKDVPTKLWTELIVKGGIRSSVREVFCVSYRELRSIRCNKERSEKKDNMCWMLPT